MVKAKQEMHQAFAKKVDEGFPLADEKHMLRLAGAEYGRFCFIAAPDL